MDGLFVRDNFLDGLFVDYHVTFVPQFFGCLNRKLLQMNVLDIDNDFFLNKIPHEEQKDFNDRLLPDEFQVWDELRVRTFLEKI